METDTQKHTRLLTIKPDQPIFIFGPCSAETEEQVMQTAKQLALSFKNIIFRAGIWKPRTRPGNFEGVGEDGLKWLQNVKKEFGFKVCTEVANAKHIELCLKHGIDMVWLGARTTVNPFSVQEIADALKGVQIPVLIKNPIHPDLSLWVGAVERIQASNIDEIGLIHRGFHYSDNVPYRNLPKWDYAIEMKRLFTDYPMICDPSHISGVPDLIPKVAQKAFDLAMDGLMIECHISPKDALSDVSQQIEPKQLIELVNSLQFKVSNIDNEDFKNELNILRNKIDSIDEELLEKLSQRMHYMTKIGEYKNENNITILQLDRWKEILEKGLENGKSLGLTDEFVKKLFTVIHIESIAKQQSVSKNKN